MNDLRCVALPYVNEQFDLVSSLPVGGSRNASVRLLGSLQSLRGIVGVDPGSGAEEASNVMRVSAKLVLRHMCHRLQQHLLVVSFFNLVIKRLQVLVLRWVEKEACDR